MSCLLEIFINPQFFEEVKCAKSFVFCWKTFIVWQKTTGNASIFWGGLKNLFVHNFEFMGLNNEIINEKVLIFNHF